jgi:hypothetical protein
MWDGTSSASDESTLSPALSTILEDDAQADQPFVEHFLTLNPAESLGLLVRGRDSVQLAGIRENTQAVVLAASLPSAPLRVSSVNGVKLRTTMPASEFVLMLAKERQEAVDDGRTLTVGFTLINPLLKTAALSGVGALIFTSPTSASLPRGSTSGALVSPITSSSSPSSSLSSLHPIRSSVSEPPTGDSLMNMMQNFDNDSDADSQKVIPPTTTTAAADHHHSDTSSNHDDESEGREEDDDDRGEEDDISLRAITSIPKTPPPPPSSSSSLSSSRPISIPIRYNLSPPRPTVIPTPSITPQTSPPKSSAPISPPHESTVGAFFSLAPPEQRIIDRARPLVAGTGTGGGGSVVVSPSRVSNVVTTTDINTTSTKSNTSKWNNTNATMTTVPPPTAKISEKQKLPITNAPAQPHSETEKPWRLGRPIAGGGSGNGRSSSNMTHEVRIPMAQMAVTRSVPISLPVVVPAVSTRSYIQPPIITKTTTTTALTAADNELALALEAAVSFGIGGGGGVDKRRSISPLPRQSSPLPPSSSSSSSLTSVITTTNIATTLLPTPESAHIEVLAEGARLRATIRLHHSEDAARAASTRAAKATTSGDMDAAIIANAARDTALIDVANARAALGLTPLSAADYAPPGALREAILKTAAETVRADAERVEIARTYTWT